MGGALMAPICLMQCVMVRIFLLFLCLKSTAKQFVGTPPARILQPNILEGLFLMYSFTRTFTDANAS